jgi:tRNA pseudouridine55 synthase
MALFGVLAVNKPKGLSSRFVVNRVQHAVSPDKAGHTGTLDPLATGVLLLAIGNATKLVEFSLEHSKCYVATFEFGKTSDTLDCVGNVTEVADGHIPSEDELRSELLKWVGTVQQVPPQFSAVNIGGKRAYRLARKGVEFELEAREIVIHELELLEFQYPFFKLKIDCGSGTYVRSLGRDVARGLRNHAIMTDLVRTRVGDFHLNECVEFDALRSREEIAPHLKAPQRLLQEWPFISFTDAQVTDLRHGKQMNIPAADGMDRIATFDPSGELVGLMIRIQDSGLFRSVRVFNTIADTPQPMASSSKQSPES